MAINLDDRYPGRANGKTLDYPQGSFKNRTSPNSKDGTYLEQDWANDQLAFFQSLMSDAGLTANGTVDTVQASQYFNALMLAVANRFPKFATFSEIVSLTQDEGPIICSDKGGAIYIWNSGQSGYVPLIGDETHAGSYKVATEAESKGFSDDSKIITPKKLGMITDLRGLEITDTAVMEGTNNTITMDNLVPSFGLEVGDVIQVEVAGSYKKLHTVESVSNGPDEITVNYEHCGSRGDGSLKLINNTGPTTVKLIQKWYAAPLGLGQAWVVLSNERAFLTNYTNTTNRTISASNISSAPNGSSSLLSAVQVNSISFENRVTYASNLRPHVCVDVCAGDTYRYNATGMWQISELR